MLTLSNLTSHVTHALGGSPSSEITAIDIVNQAGRHMFTHAWKFRVRPSHDLATVASQSYVDLPANVGEIVTIRMKDGLNDSVSLTSYDKLLLIRNGSLSTGRSFHAALTYYDKTAVEDTTVAMSPRLELAPTPTAVDTITVFYRANWTELAETTDIVAVPEYAEALLILYVRAFAQGYEEEGLTQRVAEVDASPMFHRTAIQDGMLLPEYGAIDGGHIASLHGGARLPFDTIADPQDYTDYS